MYFAYGLYNRQTAAPLDLVLRTLQNWIIVIALVHIVILIAFNLPKEEKMDENDLVSFAKCLSHNRVEMFGSPHCSHCQHQKSNFGEAWDYIIFNNCDEERKVCEDNRITGGLVLLDPWFEPCSDQVLYKKLNKPIFSLRSTTFMEIEQLIVKINKHIEVNNEEKEMIISGYLKDSTHNSPTDLMLLMPRELKMFGILNNIHDIHEQVVMQTTLTRLFLDASLKCNTDDEKGMKVPIKTLVLEQFRKRLQELKMQDVFTVDN